MNTLRYAVAVFFVTSAASGASAQVLTGHVVDAGSGAPVGAAYVRLLDSAGTVTGSWLTADDGVYRVNAKTQGMFRVRIERIGFTSFESEAFAIDATAPSRDFKLTGVPVELSEIKASGERVCKARAPMSPESLVLWEEIRKALDVTSWTTTYAPVRFRLADRMRPLSPQLQPMGRATEQITTGVKSASPFAALPRDSLFEKGFIQNAGKGHYKYFAPDAALVVSDAFQATHCFQVRTDSRRPKLVGLAFEPTGAIKPYDVRGVLWIDRASAMLASMVFSYDDVPAKAPYAAEAAGGDVEFARLENGMWIVSVWRLRVPIIGGVNTSERTRVDRVTVVQERSFVVKDVSIDGRVVFMGPEN